MKPACMSPDEWAAWQEMNERLFGLGRSDSPCRDCTPLFHADMLAGGMCDGVPLPAERAPKPPGPKIREVLERAVGWRNAPLADRRAYWRQRRRESRARAVS